MTEQPSKLFLSCADRLDATDLPSDCVLDLATSINGEELYAIGLEHIVFDLLPLEPTYQLTSGYFSVTVDETAETFTWTEPRSEKVDNVTDLITQLNASWQANASGSGATAWNGQSPFSFDSATGIISFTLTTTDNFSISVSNSASGWQQLGYSSGGDTTSTDIGSGQHRITFDSSPNLCRTSLIYILLDFLENSTGSSKTVASDTLCAVPVPSTKFGEIISYEPANDMSVAGFDSQISQFRVQLLDDKREPLRLQLNANVFMTLKLKWKVSDLNKNAIPDYKEVTVASSSALINL